MARGLQSVFRQRVTHDCLVSLIVVLKGFPCFRDVSHGASHPTSPFMIFALVILWASGLE